MLNIQKKVLICFVFVLFTFLYSNYNAFVQLNVNPIAIELSAENGLPSNIVSDGDSVGDDFFVDFFELCSRDMDCSLDIIQRLSILIPHGQHSVWQPPQ